MTRAGKKWPFVAGLLALWSVVALHCVIIMPMGLAAANVPQLTLISPAISKQSLANKVLVGITTPTQAGSTSDESRGQHGCCDRKGDRKGARTAAESSSGQEQSRDCGLCVAQIAPQVGLDVPQLMEIKGAGRLVHDQASWPISASLFRSEVLRPLARWRLDRDHNSSSNNQHNTLVSALLAAPNAPS